MSLFRPINESRKITISWRKNLSGRPRRSRILPIHIFSRHVIEPRNQEHQLSLDPIVEEQDNSISGELRLSNVEVGSESGNPDSALSFQDDQMSDSNRAQASSRSFSAPNSR